MNVLNVTRQIALSLVLFFTLLDSAMAVQPTSTSGLTGTWYNVNPSTGGVVRIDIVNSLGTIYIKTYGACSPTPCDHGYRVGKVYSKSIGSNLAESVTADWNFGFKTARVDAVRDYSIDSGTFLRLNYFNLFAPGDTRKDYFSSELFRR